MKRRPFALAVPLLAAGLLVPGLCGAQGYPTKTVKIIAPVQPGGGVDLVGRTVAEQLGRALGQSFIVENVSGGGGVIASQTVARAAADGYTLMVGYVATHGTVPAVRKVPYDAVAVTKKLNDEINKALDPMPMTPEQFGSFMQADIARWAKLARERNITVEN